MPDETYMLAKDTDYVSNVSESSHDIGALYK